MIDIFCQKKYKQSMKRIYRSFFILLLILCSFHLFGDDAENIDLNKYQNIILAIIDNLYKIVQENPANELVYQTFTVSDEAIRNKKLFFEIAPSRDKILNGMSFAIHESGEISLSFGLKYLDTYHPDSSIHYSILIHEYRHLFDYLRLGDTFKNGKKDEKERYWFELDAMRIETEFIKDYLAETYNLSNYEKYLLQSFEDDNLNTASIVFLKESMNVFFYFDNLENRYRNNEMRKEDIIKELSQRGQIYIDGYLENNNDHIKYGRFIEISTFRRYLTRMLITMNNIPELTWGELFSQYKDIEEIYNTMGDILKTNNSIHSSYRDSLNDSFETDITDNLK
jgi:hypothetical protein